MRCRSSLPNADPPGLATCESVPAAQGAEYVAAKIYRPRMLRNLKNDHQYREGRVELDNEGRRIIKDADLHAMAKRSSYGEELRHQSWIAHEYNAMQSLYEAGEEGPGPMRGCRHDTPMVVTGV